MTAATDTDLQQVKDLITAGNAAIQKQIAELAVQIAELRGEARETKAELKGDIRELRSELKALDTKFDEKTKNLDQRITSKEFTIRGITVTILGGLLLAFGKLLFFGKI
jgi:predicted  nucleic acid-binding Zn-ribbon protein